MEEMIRDRPARRPLIPRWLVVTGIAIILVITGATVAVVMTMRNGLIAVPDVSGKSLMEAKAVLSSAGLSTRDGGEWFSMSVPKGSIVSQEPSAGALVRRGDTITIVISAGSETFPMPDVVGTSGDEARASLEALGLRVTLETVESTATEGIVTETFPTAGQDVLNGSTVRVRVAGRSVASSVLLPYKMDGVTVAIDPAPSSSGTDITLEVSRRLQALLEASGARVVVTRSVSSTASQTADRAALITETSATVVVALDTAVTGPAGISLTIPPSTEASGNASQLLAERMVEALRAPGQQVQSPTTAASAILAASKAPGARVVLGNSRVQSDSSRFSDPAWADTIARALYRALGANFGQK